MPKARCAHSAANYGRQLFVYGGRDDAAWSDPSDCVMRELALFNTVDEKWEAVKIQGKHVPGKRFGACALATDIGFLIFGGMKLESY